MSDYFVLSCIILVGLSLLNYLFFGFLSAFSLISISDFEEDEEEAYKQKYSKLEWLIKNEQTTTASLRFLAGANFLLLGLLWAQRLVLPVKTLVSSFYQNGFSQGSYLNSYAVVMPIVQVLALLLFLYIIYTLFVVLSAKVAVIHPERYALHAASFIYLLVRVVAPITVSSQFLVHCLMKLFGLDAVDEGDVTEQEIISMVNEGHEQGVLLASEAEMITNIFEYGDKEVQDIMTNRSQIVGIPVDMTLTEALDFMLAEQFSRFPVYEDTLDHIVGILYLKDAMRMQTGHHFDAMKLSEIEGLMREAFYVPQTLKIDSMFHKMQANKVQLAIVIDEYGQTDGLISMEDILEEIVGNIFDEYDETGTFIEEKGNDEYIIDGLTPLRELEDTLNISFEEEQFETLNGFMISRLEHIPENGEHFCCEYSGFHFEMMEVENRVIQRVLVRKLETVATDELSEITANQELVLEDNIK